jgi:hypothetical protein
MVAALQHEIRLPHVVSGFGLAGVQAHHFEATAPPERRPLTTEAGGVSAEDEIGGVRLNHYPAQ